MNPVLKWNHDLNVYLDGWHMNLDSMISWMANLCIQYI